MIVGYSYVPILMESVIMGRRVGGRWIDSKKLFQEKTEAILSGKRREITTKKFWKRSVTRK
jgi:hypothetical protein